MASQRFLQTQFWSSFKGNHGWTPLYFTLNDDCTVEKLTDEEYSAKSAEDPSKVLSCMYRSFSIKIKKFSIVYVPMAIEIPENACETAEGKSYAASYFASDENIKDYFCRLEKIAQSLKTFIPKNTICVRFDPPVDFHTVDERQDFLDRFNSLSKAGSVDAVKSDIAVQPPDTTILCLNPDEERLLAGMKNKWRYNIKLAGKKGVEVEKHFGNDSDFEESFNHFFELFEQTSKRDGVSFHGKDYYIDLLKRSALCINPDSTNQNPSGENYSTDKAPLITLYLAKHEGDYLAGIITLFCKREAVYLYGASGNIKRNLMPAYLLQWTAIQDAKKAGCPCYDFYGMPPTDDENHPMHGLYLFKTGFGGQNVHRPGSFDVRIDRKGYGLYVKAERFRAWFHRVLLKKLRGR